MAKRRNPTSSPFSGAYRKHPGRNTSQIQGEKGKGDVQYKNIETKVNNREYFDDDYEVKQENQIARDEAKRVKENRSDRGKRR